MSITILNRLAQRKDEPTTLFGLAKKRSRNPALKAFGGRLTALRDGRSRGVIIKRLEALGVAFDESSLFQYEAGTVWAPDVGVLWGLSRVYGVGLNELVALLRANRTKTDAEQDDWRDLIRHSTEYKKGSTSTGESDDTTAARVRELEIATERLRTYEDIFARLRPLLGQAVVLLGDQGDAASAKKTPRGSRH